MTFDLSRLGGWSDLRFFADTLPGIATALASETRQVLPARAQTFAALELTQPHDTRVVILGQDPYPTPGDAHGLAFSVRSGHRLPPSLRNIFIELRDDLGTNRALGDLSDWARQGVLLLNTALTVPAHDAHGHRDLGWHALADQVLARLDGAPRCLLLWGKAAQATGRVARNPGHFRIETAHPSPLSSHRGFFGSRPFSRVNAWLAGRGENPVDWAG